MTTPPFLPAPIVIKASMLRWATTCDRRIWLDAYGDRSLRDPITPIQAYLVNRGFQQEAAVQQAIAPNAQRIQAHSWAEGVEQTLTLMRQGAAKIAQAFLEVPFRLDDLEQQFVLRGKPDWIIRDPLTSALPFLQKHPRYVPVEVKSYRALADADRLQLDLYVWILMEIQQVEALSAYYYVPGEDGSKPVRRPHTFDKTRLFGALEKVAHLLAAMDSEPAVKIKVTCRRCEWDSECRDAADADLDVTLLPGLSYLVKERLEQAGITSLTQVAAMNADELRRFKGIDTAAEGIIAQAQAFIDDTPVWYRALPPEIPQGGWFFDIETIMPENEEIWSVGWGSTDGQVRLVMVDSHVVLDDAQCYQTFTLPDGRAIWFVPDADSAWRLFMAEVDDQRLIYHWSSFDHSVLRKHAPEAVRIALSGRLRDLRQVFDRTVKCPLDSISLKVVAPYVQPAFAWGRISDGLVAHFYFQQWQEGGATDVLANIAHYQASDVHALFAVWKWLVENQSASGHQMNRA